MLDNSLAAWTEKRFPSPKTLGKQQCIKPYLKVTGIALKDAKNRN
jgi:hypothetical protein